MKPKMHGRPRLALETLKRKIKKNPKRLFRKIGMKIRKAYYRFQAIYQKYVQRNRPMPVLPNQDRIRAARVRLIQEVGHIWHSPQNQV